LGKPFVIIRAMSDTADHDANVNFDKFIIEAGKKSAEGLIRLLEEMV
ncbi:MAG: 5'-methylthioadenosine/S-adenosylhomocysteine nucleosidase, partial [Lactococcus lactis]|nr:5'-methylthioadenosine/S-adenosylhomocysteine nucleosidase [Lactococcus lactis]